MKGASGPFKRPIKQIALKPLKFHSAFEFSYLNWRVCATKFKKVLSEVCREVRGEVARDSSREVCSFPLLLRASKLEALDR